jgi:hypothetical protein
MAKPARFTVGTSGSGKHTEVKGNGASLGGRAPAESGPRIGSGVLGRRVRPEYDRDSGGNGAPAVRGMRRYSEE